MPILENRKIVKQGRSYVLSLPQGWLRYYHLGAGDMLELVADVELVIWIW